MPPAIAAIIFIAGIVGLFALDRDSKTRSSWALWLPTVWLLIAGSRPVSFWLGMTPEFASLDEYYEGSQIDRGVYALLLAAGILMLLGRRAAVAEITHRNWPILLFVLYCAISVIWSDFPGVALKRWFKSLGDYVMVMILLTERDWATSFKQVLARGGFVLLPLSVLLIKYFPGLGRAYALRWEGTQFFTGVAGDKNMLGMICLVFGFATAWQVLQVWRTSRRERTKALIVHGTILAMAIWLLYISNSMTSLACFVLVSALIAAHTFSRVARKRWVLHLSAVAIVLVCASVLFLNVGDWILESMGRNPTLTGRTDIWDALLEVPINPVVGAGFESFWLGERLIHLWTSGLTGINEAHNGYLEVYLNLGWIGVAFLAGLLWRGYKNVLRVIEQDPETGRLLLGYFIITVIYNFTESGFRSPGLLWIAFLFSAISLPQNMLAGVLATEADTANQEPINVLLRSEHSLRR